MSADRLLDLKHCGRLWRHKVVLNKPSGVLERPFFCGQFSGPFFFFVSLYFTVYIKHWEIQKGMMWSTGGQCDFNTRHCWFGNMLHIFLLWDQNGTAVYKSFKERNALPRSRAACLMFWHHSSLNMFQLFECRHRCTCADPSPDPAQWSQLLADAQLWMTEPSLKSVFMAGPILSKGRTKVK